MENPTEGLMECPPLCSQLKSMRNGLQAEVEEFLHWEWAAKRMNTPAEKYWVKQGKYHGNRVSPGSWDHLGWKSLQRSLSPSSIAKATANHVPKCHFLGVFESCVLLSRLKKTNSLIMAFNNSLVFHLMTFNFFCMSTYMEPSCEKSPASRFIILCKGCLPQGTSIKFLWFSLKQKVIMLLFS